MELGGENQENRVFFLLLPPTPPPFPFSWAFAARLSAFFFARTGASFPRASTQNAFRFYLDRSRHEREALRANDFDHAFESGGEKGDVI